MVFTNFTKGVLVGVGASLAGFVIYKANQEKVDTFLRNQGLPIAQSGKKNYANCSIEDLMKEKEDLEDLIAEREFNEEDEVIVCQNDATVTA